MNEWKKMNDSTGGTVSHPGYNGMLHYGREMGRFPTMKRQSQWSDPIEVVLGAGTCLKQGDRERSVVVMVQ